MRTPRPPSRLPPSLVPVSAAGSPLQTAGTVFDWLTHGPSPIGIDGRRVAGLPARQVPADELRDLLAHRRLPSPVHDQVWAHLVRRARAEGALAKLVCVAMALPALDEACQRLCRTRPAPRHPRRNRRSRAATARAAAGLRVEVESAVLAGFLADLAVVDLRRPAIAARLAAAGDEAGRAALRAARHAPVPRLALVTTCPPPAPARHPDLILARAVADHALTHSEAVLIGATWLEPLPPADIARARGQSLRQVRAARTHAERKLAAYLRGPTQPTNTADDPRSDDPSADAANAAGHADSGAEPGDRRGGPRP